MFSIIGAIISAGLKYVLSYFMPSKDEKLGQLEVTNKANVEAINDLEKADAARNDPAELERVHAEFVRPE